MKIRDGIKLGLGICIGKGIHDVVCQCIDKAGIAAYRKYEHDIKKSADNGNQLAKIIEKALREEYGDEFEDEPKMKIGFTL